MNLLYLNHLNLKKKISGVAELFFALILFSGPMARAQVSLATYHNDQARDGWNQNETTLTTANVNSTSFGKLFSDAVDGQVYAQPLYMPNVSIGGGTHNVVYVVTEHDSAYAFDADNAGVTYWHDTFIGGVTMVVSTSADAGGCPQVTPEIGITDTPVIDPSTGTMYFVAMTKIVSGGVTTFLQQLHAVDIGTGNEKFNGPTTIQAVDPKNASVTFIARAHKERCALALVNGVVYTSWTSHCDFNTWGAYHGWVIGYNASNISQQMSVYDTTPNGTNPEGSLWESGNGPSVDSAGNLYYLTSNGTFDQTAPVTDYSQCFLKLNTKGNAVTVLDYFSPMNEATLSGGDQDIGSAGQCLLPASWGTAAHPNLMLGADKPGDIYVVDTANMGHFSSTSNNMLQMVVSIGGSGYTSPAIYSNGTTNYVYWGMTGQALKAYTFANGLYVTPLSSKTTATFGGQGCVPSVSSNGSSNGIVWALANGTPVVLHAYDATNLGTELYNSSQAAGNRDSAVGAVVKFAPPSVVNGKVYVPTANSLVVYGLLVTPTSTPTGSATATRTSTPTATNTITATKTSTPTATNSSTNTSTGTFTPSPTNTATLTATRTFTNSPTSTMSPTPTATASPTHSPTLTPTGTATPSSTSSLTPTGTPTLIPSPTATASATMTSTPTNTATITSTPTNTLTGTPTPTTTSTPTFTNSPTGTLSPTATSTATGTPTVTPTKTNTFTGTSTPTATNTNSPTPTFSATFTPTHTSTPTNSATATFTYTSSTTSTPTSTPTFADTMTSTPTPATIQVTSIPSGPATQLTGSSNVPVLQLQLTNPSGTAVTLTGVTITDSGTGSPSTGITGITLSNNGTTLASTNFTGTTAAFNISLVIPASGSVTLQVASNFTATGSAGTYQFTLTGGAGTNGQAVNFNGLPASGAVVTVAAAMATPTSPATFTPTPSPTATFFPTQTLSPTIRPTNSATPSLSSTPVLYPNPAPGGGTITLRLFLTASSDVRYQIFTVSFRKVQDITAPNAPAGLNEITIPLVDRTGTPLANGLYYIVVTSQGKRTVLKLLVIG